ncbi:hypothetical protein LJC07_08125 [Christensenellaceae bacterium OttesenSCG-928-L17]|nr:hypothetical protein [Christensenellaceae bacterium OttesenSCG-928-L17]
MRALHQEPYYQKFTDWIHRTPEIAPNGQLLKGRTFDIGGDARAMVTINAIDGSVLNMSEGY